MSRKNAQNANKPSDTQITNRKGLGRWLALGSEIDAFIIVYLAGLFYSSFHNLRELKNYSTRLANHLTTIWAMVRLLDWSFVFFDGLDRGFLFIPDHLQLFGVRDPIEGFIDRFPQLFIADFCLGIALLALDIQRKKILGFFSSNQIKRVKRRVWQT